MASVVEPPAIEALDDARRELGAALGELRELGIELDEFAEQSTVELEKQRESFVLRSEELHAYYQQLAKREREFAALDDAEETAARQVVQLEESLAATRQQLSQEREQGEGLVAELAKARRAAETFEEEQREALSREHNATTAQSDQQALLLSELESLRRHASQLEEELEEAHRVSAMAAPVPRPGQEAHLSGLIEQLTSLLSHGGAVAPQAAPSPPSPASADGSSAVVGSLKEQFARLQMQAARRRETA